MTIYPPPSPRYLGPPAKFSKGDNKPIHRIVLHGTVSPTGLGQAVRIAGYFRGSTAGGSAHYVVDPGEVVQSAYDSVVCWHAPPNPHSLGVEFCDWVAAANGKGAPLPLDRWDDGDHYSMLRRGARLVAELCLAYDVPVRMVGPRGLRAGKHGITEHSDVSEAWGQSSHWDLGNFPRRRFVRMVRKEVAAIQTGIKATPTPATVLDTAEQRARRLRQRRAKARMERAATQPPGGNSNVPRHR